MNQDQPQTEKATPKPVKFGNRYIGCVIDNSPFSADDDCNRETIEFAESFGYEVSEPLPDATSEDYSQALSEEADGAVDWLNEQENPPYCYWAFEDNSLFLMPSIESAKESVGFVSVKSLSDARSLGIETDPEDSEYPPADYRGEWLHVNDHGNATLYVRTADNKDKEIWSLG